MIKKMDRIPWYGKPIIPIMGFGISSLFLSDTLGNIVGIILAVIGGYLVYMTDMSKIVFDFENNEVQWYRFFLMNTQISVSDIRDVEKHTESRTVYNKNAQSWDRQYTYTINVYTVDESYGITVYDRKYLNEFSVKLKDMIEQVS